MPSFRNVCRSLLPILAGCALTGGIATTTAGASYGELGRFGKAGTKLGEFNMLTPETNAFGVDPTDNSVYVGDKKSTNVYRVQKFSVGAKGEFKFVASVSFKAKNAVDIEGLAVDPVKKRVYALTAYSREGEPIPPADEEKEVAGALYAFSTVPTGEKLVRDPETTVGTEKNEVLEEEGGVLASTATLGSQSEVLGGALLEPSGIALDPTTGDIVLSGLVDEGEASEPEDRAALWRVHSNGTLGAKWVDQTDFFEEEAPTSPAVTSTGIVYVLGGALAQAGTAIPIAQIDRIPAGFKSGEAPTAFVSFDANLEEVVEFPGLPEPQQGGGMSIGPDGTVWVRAAIKSVTEGKPNGRQVGALSFTSTGAERGWIGGEKLSAGLGNCVVSFEGHALVAAGKEERLFMLDTNPAHPGIVEFGPGGSKCPLGTAGAVNATANGKPLSGSVPAGTKITFESRLTNANALKTEWNFQDGSSVQSVSNDSPLTAVTHAFASPGTFTVTGTVTTDNLASPTLTITKTVTVEPGVPTAQFSATEATVGQATSFDAKNSSDPNGPAGQPLKYAWSFGDGTPETAASTTASISHTYGAAGSYQVKLTVTDALGKKAEKTQTITVKTPESPGNPETPGGPGPGGGQTPIIQPPGGGQSGVLSYKAALAGTSLTVSSAGALAVKVNCLGQSSCSGTVTLKTLGAVSAQARSAKKRKAILTLASGSFSIAGGHIKTLTLHLSSKARALLSRSHVLRAQATILARDTAGASHTTQTTVTLHAAKAKHH